MLMQYHITQLLLAVIHCESHSWHLSR